MKTCNKLSLLFVAIAISGCAAGASGSANLQKMSVKELRYQSRVDRETFSQLQKSNPGSISDATFEKLRISDQKKYLSNLIYFLFHKECDVQSIVKRYIKVIGSIEWGAKCKKTSEKPDFDIFFLNSY